MPIKCEQGWKLSGYKGSSGGELNSCLHCGRTKEAHARDAAKPPKLPAAERAKDWLMRAGYDKTTFYHLAENLLTAYIVWDDNFNREE